MTISGIVSVKYCKNIMEYCGSYISSNISHDSSDCQVVSLDLTTILGLKVPNATFILLVLHQYSFCLNQIHFTLLIPTTPTFQYQHYLHSAQLAIWLWTNWPTSLCSVVTDKNIHLFWDIPSISLVLYLGLGCYRHTTGYNWKGFHYISYSLNRVWMKRKVHTCNYWY